MSRRSALIAGLLAALGVVLFRSAVSQTAETAVPLKKAEAATLPKIAPSRIVHVTVYPNNALVTREVSVPEGTGSIELVVSPLPAQTVNSSLYSEGSDGIRVLTTRYRMRPIKEDTREEVRKAEAQLKQLQEAAQKLQSEQKMLAENLQMVSKLENFTGASLQHMTEKGILNADSVIALSKHIMEARAEKMDSQVQTLQKMQQNQEQMQFVQRQLSDLAAGSSKTERDAVIVVDKTENGPGKVRLNYLVNTASWRPQYKVRAGKDKDPIQVEYLAAIVQQSGEDWSNVAMTLSTAEPMLNSAPPELKKLEVAAVPRHAPNMPAPAQPGMPGGGGGGPGMGGFIAPQSLGNNPYSANVIDQQAKTIRKQAREEFKRNMDKSGEQLLNTGAALEQARDLLAPKEEMMQTGIGASPGRPGGNGNEGPSVTYHLPAKLSVPSRTDEQIIEVAKLDMAPEYYYKAVPVLTAHVYRLANLINKSQYVLLPGEATMYIGTDFVGRSDLPLVAIGEQLTVGFGVDPQVQVHRQLLDKTRTTQGDNQVLKYEYRILLSSYKTEPVKMQLWDRLPHTETESVGVNLVKTEPKLSADELYLRENRPHNLLRWDLALEPTMNGTKALAVNYEFKLELGRQMLLGNFMAK